MNRNHRALCQASGCHSLSVRAVEIDLPAAWEATQHFTTLTVVVGLCCKHGTEVSRRVEAVLEARSDLYNLVTIVEAAVRTEKVQQLRLDAATDRGDQLDRENGGLRQQLEDTEAALRVARRDARCLVPAGDAA
jgi:hypothetical protein